MSRRIGRALIDKEAMTLSVDGESVRVEPLVFRLILYLADNSGRVVSKDELLETLWEGRAVSDSALTRAVSLARRALRTPELPNPIRAIYGTGYQLRESEGVTAPSLDGVTAPAPGRPLAGAFPFVGRESELGALSTALDALAQGGGGMFLIRGEAGIGKTRLAEETIRRARALGLATRVGRCSESGGAPSFWPWIQILRQEIEERGPLEPGQLGERAAGRLNSLVRLEDAPADVRPSPGLLSMAGDRFSLFDSVSRLLINRAAIEPTVLVIDDLHCADRESLALLRFIAAELSREPLLVLVAYRDTELPTLERRVVAEAASASGAQVLELRGLQERDVAHILLDRIGETTLAAQLSQKSGGNPLFLTSLVSVLALSPSAGRNLLELETARLPLAIRDTIGVQLRRMTPSCLASLAVAAVIGREFDLEVLRRLLADDDAVFAALEEGLERRVIQEWASQYRFVHLLVRDYLYESAGLRDRARWHLLLADDLGRGRTTMETASAIAHHHRQAIPVAGRERAITSTIRAAQNATSQFAYEESASQYEKAIALIGVEQLEDRCKCLLGMLEALVRAGDRSAAWSTCIEAVRLARDLRRPDLLSQAALVISPGFLSIETAFYDQAHVDLLEEAIAANTNAESLLKIKLLSRLATALYWSGNQARRDEASSAALRLAKRSRNPESLAHALYARHSSLWNPDFVDERISIARELVEIAGQLGDRETTLLYRSTLIADLAEAGDCEALDVEIDLFCGESEEIRQPESMWLSPVFQAMRQLMRGNFGAVEQLAQRVRELGARVGSEDAQNCWAAQVAMAGFETGTGDGIIDLMRAHAIEHPNVVNLFRTAPPWAAAELGRLAQAREDFDVYALSNFATVPRDMNWLGSLAILAMVSAELRDTRSSAKLLELLGPYANRFGFLGYGVLCLGAISAHLGRLAAITGDHEEADAYFEQGLRMNQTAGAKPWFVRCQYSQGIELIERGAKRQGMGILEDALARAGSLGMHHVAQRCRQALEAPLEPEDQLRTVS